MKLPDYQIRLDAWYKSKAGKPLVYGENDCCLFVADAVLAMTGIDPAKAIRGTYNSEQGAAKIIARHGGLKGLIDSLGFESKTIAFATVGDIGLAKQEREELLVLCMAGYAIAQGKRNIEFVPFDRLIHVWGV